MTKRRVCPECGGIHLEIKEITQAERIYSTQAEDGVIVIDNCTASENIPVKLVGICGHCGHEWTIRGEKLLDALPEYPDLTTNWRR